MDDTYIDYCEDQYGFTSIIQSTPNITHSNKDTKSPTNISSSDDPLAYLEIFKNQLQVGHFVGANITYQSRSAFYRSIIDSWLSQIQWNIFIAYNYQNKCLSNLETIISIGTMQSYPHNEKCNCHLVIKGNGSNFIHKIIRANKFDDSINIEFILNGELLIPKDLAYNDVKMDSYICTLAKIQIGSFTNENPELKSEIEFVPDEFYGTIFEGGIVSVI